MDGDESQPGQPRGLLLDIGGVVVRNAVEMSAVLARLEPGLSSTLVQWGGQGGDRDDLWWQMLAGEVTERTYWTQRSGELGAALSRTWDTRALINLIYAEPPEVWLRAETVQLLRDARAAGIPLVPSPMTSWLDPRDSCSERGLTCR